MVRNSFLYLFQIVVSLFLGDVLVFKLISVHFGYLDYYLG